MARRTYWLITSLLPCICQASPITPTTLPSATWFPPLYRLEVTPSYTFCSIHKINSSHGNFTQSEQASLLGSTLQFSYESDWTALASFSVADTTERHWGFNEALLALGYNICNDILGDSFSLSVFASGAIHSSRATKDILLDHSGEFEAEAHVILGKELPCECTWSARSALDLGLGLANRGAPYFHGTFLLEKNLWDEHIVTLFTKSFIGFGSHALTPKFHGFGPVNHRSVTVGAGYRFLCFDYGDLGLTASLGVYAYNYPKLPFQATLFWQFFLGP